MKPKNKEKPKTPTGWTAKKIAVIAIGVLFVVLMIVSSLGMSWLNYFSQAKGGETAVVDFTIRDDLGRAIVTTTPSVFNDTVRQGNVVFYSQPLQMQVNATTMKNITKIPVMYRDGTQLQFGLLRDEMNIITRNLSGMRAGEVKQISLVMPFDSLETVMSPEQFSTLVKNVTEARQDEQIVLALAENPSISVDNVTPADQYIRTFYVKDISPAGVQMKYGYATADIQVRSMKNS
jgi:hypothetical protein